MVLSKTHLFLVLSTRFCTECEAVVMDQEVLGNLRRPWENSGDGELDRSRSWSSSPTKFNYIPAVVNFLKKEPCP
ncbi:uncharacterized protein ACOB8E_012378 isoform 2-T4 [Sarcophilus harrisii]